MKLMTATVAAVALSLSPVAAQASVPAAPEGSYDQAIIKRAFVRSYYEQSPSVQRNICYLWDINYKRQVRRYARISVRNGYSYNDSVKGLVRGFLAVCGSPDSYSG